MPTATRKKLWQYYNTHLSKAFDLGYKPSIDMYDPALVHSLKYNIAEFSAFKESAFKKHLNGVLTKNEQLLSWADFKQEALKIHVDYNKNWLKAEYHQTVASANAVEKWKGFEKNKSIYPNLKYHTVGDERVREKHKAWNGLVLPMEHPFWQTNFPPNDWGCRCNVTQVDEEVTVDIESIKIKGEFKNNPALSGKVFKENAYEKVLNQVEQYNTKKLLDTFIDDSDFIDTSNPLVKISLRADKYDLDRNLFLADKCSTPLNMEIYIREHVEIKGIKNPEYLITKKYLGDRKSIQGTKGIIWNIDNAKKQMLNKAVNPNQLPYYIVWDMDEIEVLDLNDIIRSLQRKVTKERGRSIKGMIFYYNEKVAILSREQIINRDFTSLNIFK